MQPDTITLAVDVANNATTVDTDFTRFEESVNRSVYIGDTHSLTSRDSLALYRTLPTQTGNFKGVAKTSFKFTRDYPVTGVDGLATLTSPIIASVAFSIPLGISSSDIIEMRQRLVALLDLDSVMTALNYQLLI